MNIYIDKGLREVSSKDGNSAINAPKFSPENCVGNWNGAKMKRIVIFQLRTNT